jgi:hypothetical protein
MPRSLSRVWATARRGGGECGEPRRGIALLDFHHFRRLATVRTLPVHRRHTPTPTGKSLGLSPALSKDLFHSNRRSLVLGFTVHMSIRLDSKKPERYRELLEKYDTWMPDCDGVLWHGDRLIDGAIQVLEFLRSHST